MLVSKEAEPCSLAQKGHSGQKFEKYGKNLDFAALQFDCGRLNIEC